MILVIIITNYKNIYIYIKAYHYINIINDLLKYNII